MDVRWRIEKVTVSPEGEAPWQVTGALDALAADSLDIWGFTDWTWNEREILSFLRRAEYERCELLVAVDTSARPADPAAILGAVIVELPLVDNTSFVSGSIWTRPGIDCRADLLDASLELAAREGRTTYLLETDHLPPTPDAELVTPKTGVGRVPADTQARVALSRGLELEQVERISTFHFPADLDRLERLRADAADRAGTDYVVHTWQGETPERWLDSLAALIGRMSVDAPLAGIEYEAEAWDADRVRARDAERPVKDRGSLSVVIEHAPSGELAAFTEVEWPLARPEVAYQHDTLVAGPHRGRRLGMLVKTTQLLTLPQVRPALGRLHTWNATENRHMLGINEAVGFTITGCSGEWQLTRPTP